MLPNWKFAMHSKSYVMGTYTNKGFDAYDYFDKKSWNQLKLLYSDYNKNIDQKFYSDQMLLCINNGEQGKPLLPILYNSDI